jgi:Anti-sigma-K factor rskA/Putative zinc-finger
MRTPRRPEPHTLAGAYALDAIDGPDRARFERHLDRCPTCAAELHELRDVTARLAGAAAADPPANLIEQVTAAAARTRQLPPAAARGRRTARTRRAGPGRPRRAAPRWVAAGLTAAVLAGAAVTGLAAVTAEHHLSSARQSDHAIAEVLNAPDAVLLTARVTAGGTATVVMSRRDRALVFTTDGLPPLRAGRCYQLWLTGPAGDRPAGVLPASDHGMTSPVIATGLAAGDWVALTVEPAGHSPGSATAPILMLNLTA